MCKTEIKHPRLPFSNAFLRVLNHLRLFLTVFPSFRFSRGRLFAVQPDGFNKHLADINKDQLLKPDFDISEVLARFD